MSQNKLSTTVTVTSPQGLHARPADLLVKLAMSFESSITLQKGNAELVDASSILSLLTLGAEQGTELSVFAEGDDAAEAITAVEDLFGSGFGETEGIESADPSPGGAAPIIES